MAKEKIEKQRHSEAVTLIEQLLKIKGMKKNELAEILGITAPKLSQLFAQYIRFDDAVEIINKMGFDVIIKRTKAVEGMIAVEPNEKCDVCPYVKFAKAMEEAINLLHANYTEAGTELDFIPDEEKGANFVDVE